MIIIANACRKFSLANIRFLLVVTLIYINERNIELYIPTDQLGRHVLMTVDILQASTLLQSHVMSFESPFLDRSTVLFYKSCCRGTEWIVYVNTWLAMMNN